VADVLWEIFGKLPSIIKENGTEAAVDFWLDAPAYENTIRDPKVTERVKEIGYDYTFWYFLNDNPSFNVDPPASQQLHNISLPTLIITAEYDLDACLEAAIFWKERFKMPRKLSYLRQVIS
jgi:hypothetical protein